MTRVEKTSWRALAVLLLALATGCSRCGDAPPPQSDLAPTVERLVAQLREADDEAAAALVAIGAPAVPQLAGAAADPDPDVRVLALTTVGQIGGPAAVDLLLAALADEDEDVRLAAVEALGGAGDRRAVRPLMNLYGRDESAPVRYEVLTSLGRLGDAAAADLLESETRSSEAHARGWALDALCQLRDPRAAARAMALLHDPDFYVRRQALQSCREALGGAQGRAMIIETAIADADFENTVWARRVLSDQRAVADQRAALEEAMRNAALAALASPDLAPAQKLQAAFLLGDLRDARATPLLLEGLASPTVAVRQHAAHLLGQVADARAVPALVAALDDREELIRATAYDSLQQHARAGDAAAGAAVRAYKGPMFNQPMPR